MKQHTFDAFLVVAAHKSRMVEVALLCRFLLGEDVTVVSVLSLDFAGTGEREAFFGSGLSFHLRHYFTVLIS